MDNNPFDLTKLVKTGGLVEKQKYKPESYNTEEKKNMLKGFERVPNTKWLQLPIGTCIRYIRKDGDMRKGGYIKYIDPNGEFMSISLTSLDQPQSKHWRLPLSGVSELWKATSSSSHDVPSQASISVVSNDKDEQIASLKEDIRQLKIEIQRVMNQQKRIIKSVGANAMRINSIEGRRR
jgi:hypothetical protein